MIAETQTSTINQGQITGAERSQSNPGSASGRFRRIKLPSYPREVAYHCRIHGRQETARFIGVFGEGELETGLYNTPENFTFGHKTIMQLADGTLPDEEWKRYGWKG